MKNEMKNAQGPSHRNFSNEKVFSFLANFGQLRFQTLRSSRQQLRDDKRLFFQSASLCWDNYPQQSSLYHHLPYGHNWRTQGGPFFNYVDLILAIFDLLPTPGWHRQRNSFTCIGIDLHVIDIFSTTYLALSTLLKNDPRAGAEKKTKTQSLNKWIKKQTGEADPSIKNPSSLGWMSPNVRPVIEF